VQQHQAHLQQDLELARDLAGLAVGERLGAVAALQQEPPARLGFRDLALQRLDFPRNDDRRQVSERLDRAGERHRIPVGRLLLGRSGRPARRRPVRGGAVCHLSMLTRIAALQ
jgi:hypothetical protein